MPLVRPTLGALGFFTFLATWNQYLWPTLDHRRRRHEHRPERAASCSARADIDKPNLVIAGTVIASLPIVVVLLVFQRQLVRGLTAGAVKG